MKRRSARGTSLIEVLCAMSLFGLVASAIGALAAGSMVHSIRSRHVTGAAMLAQEELEDLRGLPYGDINARVSTAIVTGQQYTITTAVTPDSPAAGMKRIVVTVGWTGPEGAKSHVIETIFTSVTG